MKSENKPKLTIYCLNGGGYKSYFNAAAIELMGINYLDRRGKVHLYHEGGDDFYLKEYSEAADFVMKYPVIKHLGRSNDACMLLSDRYASAADKNGNLVFSISPQLQYIDGVRAWALITAPHVRISQQVQYQSYRQKDRYVALPAQQYAIHEEEAETPAVPSKASGRKARRDQ